MFFKQIKKNNVYPCKPKFYYIKVGSKGFKIIWAYSRDVNPKWAHMSVGRISPLVARISTASKDPSLSSNWSLQRL